MAVVQSHSVFQMNTTEESDSSNDDVFIELADAWNYVKKWYNFRNKSDSNLNSGSRIKFTRSRAKASSNKLKLNEPSPSRVSFHDLPTNVYMKILSCLDVYSLGKAAMVCRLWYNLATDDVLWESKLKMDVGKWQVIDHLSHPSLYRETMTDFTAKEIYLHCCPECRHKKQRTSLKLSIPRISFYLGFSIPKVVMFGPGLESETNEIVRRIFSGPNSPFIVKGMFPGQFDGIGSGVSLQYDGGQLNLITLYSACRSERERNAANGIRKNNFMVDRNVEDMADDNLVLVTQPVKDLCSSVDAFIYVVDSKISSKTVEIGKDELKAVVGNRWLHPKAPLLVLSCTKAATDKQYSPIHVSNVLGLRELNRPWQVRVCHVNSLYGILPGVKWLLGEVMKS